MPRMSRLQPTTPALQTPASSPRTWAARRRTPRPSQRVRLPPLVAGVLALVAAAAGQLAPRAARSRRDWVGSLGRSERVSDPAELAPVHEVARAAPRAIAGRVCRCHAGQRRGRAAPELGELAATIAHRTRSRAAGRARRAARRRRPAHIIGSAAPVAAAATLAGARPLVRSSTKARRRGSRFAAAYHGGLTVTFQPTQDTPRGS